MAKKPTITTVTTGYQGTPTINNNFTNVQNSFDNTLSLDGSTPNAMLADLDMNSNDILNAGEVSVSSLRINSQPVTPTSIVYNGVIKETKVATSNQTVFNLTTISYAPNTNNLSIYVDGVYQKPANYTETNSTRVTFSTGLHVGAIVDFVVLSIGSLTGTADAVNLTYTPAAQSLYGTTSITVKSALDQVTHDESGSSKVGFLQSGTSATKRTVQAKLRDTVSVKDFGAIGNGVIDDTSAFTAAINHLLTLGGGTLYAPQGSYLLNGTAGADTIKNGVLIPFNSSGGSENGNSNTIRITGDSEYTRLIAGSDNMYVIRLSGSHCEVSNLRIEAGGRTGVTGLALVPQNISSTTTFADQSQNSVSKLVIKDCADAIVLQCGPGTTSTSACYYNHFSDLHIVGGASGTRGIYFKTGVNSGSLNSTSNRNHFFDIRLNSLNTGVYIESGGTNNFYGMSFESINVGSSPLATPTALKIDNLDGNGIANESNRFFGGTIEYSTRDIDNANVGTEIYGLYFDGTKIQFTANPEIILGGYDASVTPQILPGYVYQQNAYLSGFRAGAIQTTFGLSFGASPQSILNYYQKGTWTPSYKGSTSDPTATYVIQLGLYERIGNMCFVSIEIQTSSASGGSGNLQIGDLPFNAAVNSGYPQYVTFGLSAGFATNEPKSGFIASNSNKLTLAIPNGADFQSSNMGSLTATVADLSNGAAANRINATFVYQVA